METRLKIIRIWNFNIPKNFLGVSRSQDIEQSDKNSKYVSTKAGTPPSFERLFFIKILISNIAEQMTELMTFTRSWAPAVTCYRKVVLSPPPIPPTATHTESTMRFHWNNSPQAFETSSNTHRQSPTGIFFLHQQVLVNLLFNY